MPMPMPGLNAWLDNFTKITSCQVSTLDYDAHMLSHMYAQYTMHTRVLLIPLHACACTQFKGIVIKVLDKGTGCVCTCTLCSPAP